MLAATDHQIRPGTRRVGAKYTGTLRNGTTVIAECGHEHTNRTTSTKTSGRSAVDCVRDLLAATANEARAAANVATFRNRWIGLTRTGIHSQDTIAKAKADAAADADAWEVLVPRVRQQLEDLGYRAVIRRSTGYAELIPAGDDYPWWAA